MRGLGLSPAPPGWDPEAPSLRQPQAPLHLPSATPGTEGHVLGFHRPAHRLPFNDGGPDPSSLFAETLRQLLDWGHSTSPTGGDRCPHGLCHSCLPPDTHPTRAILHPLPIGPWAPIPVCPTVS